MQHLDLQVIEQVLSWARSGETVWLCTVLATYGSSPRAPGSMLAVRSDGQHVGSLSGGCVEEDFLDRLQDGEFDTPVTVLRYGEGGIDATGIALPCGGILDVMVERLIPEARALVHLEVLLATLQGQQPLARRVDLTSGARHFVEDDGIGARVIHDTERAAVQIRLAPVARLIIAGISPVSLFCAQFAQGLGFEVIVCDPREEMLENFAVQGVEVRPELPSRYIAAGGSHAATAIVALTHDPRIDDLAMIEAVRTSAFYIGVMGSLRTSEKRAERLRRSGGLSDDDIARIHMPIGLDLGSKTPAEIALSVMADILRVQRGKARGGL
uniref:XdhC family protein n=1 Tax=Halomonas sp. TaxID=1486246 RepID=UPI00260C6CB1|nr:XdhC family protein [Halomonas sp.]